MGSLFALKNIYRHIMFDKLSRNAILDTDRFKASDTICSATKLNPSFGPCDGGNTVRITKANDVNYYNATLVFIDPKDSAVLSTASHVGNPKNLEFIVPHSFEDYCQNKNYSVDVNILEKNEQNFNTYK